MPNATAPKGRRRARWQEYMPIDELVEARRNPKAHDDEGLDASMERFGFVEPIVLDERTNRLVAGHGRLHRLQARRDRGEDPPDGIERRRDGRWFAPVNRGWSSADDAEADAYLVAANRLTERGGWQRDPLAEMLAELNSGPGLEGTGYTLGDLEALLAEVAPLDHQPVDQVPRLDRKQHVVCPGCGAVIDPGTAEKVER